MCRLVCLRYNNVANCSMQLHQNAVRRNKAKVTMAYCCIVQRAEAAGSHLLKTVDSVDGECGSGMQALQNAIDYIGSGLEVRHMYCRILLSCHSTKV